MSSNFGARELTGLSSEIVEKLCRDPALSNTTRLLILIALIVRGPMTLCELQKILGLSPSTIESHLEKLIELGLVEKRRVLEDRVKIVYRVTDDGLKRVLDYLRTLQELVRKLGLV